MNILKRIYQIVVCGILFQTAQPALAAAVISFDNAGTDIHKNYFLGDTVNVNILLTGLGEPGSADHLTLAGFDFDLSFDQAALAYQNTTFSSALDDSGFIFLTADKTSENVLNISGVSILGDLSAQPNELPLFSLTFAASREGTSTLVFDHFLLADASANSLNAKAFSAEINVSSVPAPATLPMICMGLFVLALLRIRKIR